MTWKPETWNAILHTLRRGFGVVPVIGPELQMVPDPESPEATVSFSQLLARRLCASLSEAEANVLPAKATLHQLALAPSFRGRPQRFAEHLMCVQEELLPGAMAAIFPESDLPVERRHPLRLLAEITAFPLYLATTPDGLMQKVMSRVRGINSDDVRGFQLIRQPPDKDLTSDHRSSLAWDLPPGWDAATAKRPFLFHLFGRLDDPDGVARFDVTEEDHFEMLCRLQSEEWRPEQLCRELRPSHVLVLGQPLADWHARFFLRLLRGDRLSEHSTATTEGIVDWLFQPGPPPPHYENLATFLDNFSETSRIYRDGAPEDFVRELHSRWLATQVSSRPSSSSSSETAPANLDRDGVFISYCSEDAAAAERLAIGLRAAGVKTFLDKSRNYDSNQPGLEHGSDYKRVLQENVRNAVFFLPLLSTNIGRKGWFRKEWGWACDADDEWFGFGDRGYLRPVIVDSSRMSAITKVMPERFQAAHCIQLPNGEPTEAFLSDIVASLHRWQGQSPSA